ncbi:MAG TPA: proline dehydrogenase family protein [Fimbriimonadaceae bacterium]|nr:proline dehydrogenase family protein [Fimbriimonadaceae bacterium]
MLARSLILKTSALRPVERMVKKSFLFRGVVERFIAGDTLEEALKVSEDLASKGFLVSLDYLGENTKSKDEALAAKATYIEMLSQIAKSPCASVTNISIKLTQCGLDQGDQFAEENFREVLKAAEAVNNFVRVDMESSEYTERTVQMLTRVWQDHKNTGTVLQTYLYRTPKDVETMIELGMRTRLVKGAYLEPASVAHPEKAKVDEAYIILGKRMMDDAFYPAFATHDEKIIDQLNRYAAEKSIDKSKFEYQMLYGIRRDIQDRLKADGYNVRVYVPFGDSWYPYFTRRLAERPANSLFILKSMFKG